MTVKVPSANLVIENARIQWRNFSGEQRQFNDAGKRNFCIMLDDHAQADALSEMGWPVKYAKPLEEGGDTRPFIQANLKYTPRSKPTVKMINSRGIVTLDEETVFMLDFVAVEKVDLIIRPFHYDWAGREGVKAMLNSIYITIREDELEQKYADVPEVDMNGRTLKAIESGNDPWATPGGDEILEEAPLELEPGF